MPNAWWAEPLKIVARFSALVSVPALFGLFAGQYLDRVYGTEPWFFLGLTALSFVLSMVLLLIGVTKEFAKIKKEAIDGMKEDLKK